MESKVDDNRRERLSEGANENGPRRMSRRSPVVLAVDVYGMELDVGMGVYYREGQTMQDAATVLSSDGCDTMLRNVTTPDRSERQRRFLDAYRQRPTIAVAARLAGVHRATVYRWLADAAFAEALRAYEVFYQENRAKLLAETERQRWRDERERERRPIRCYYLALARARKRR
jgi:hypothetical protein